MNKLWITTIVLLLVLTACTPATTPTPDQGAPTAPETAIAEATETPILTPSEAVSPEETATETEEPLTFEPRINLMPVAEGLTAPVALAAPNDGSDRLFIVDQIGVIAVVDRQGELLETPFLDIRDRMVSLNNNYDERGLLGLAFHPEYAENGRFFVYYSAPRRSEAPAGWDHTSILSEFSVSPTDVNIADLQSEKIILQIDQPQANHNAGSILFGPEGYLYVPLGDGGGSSDASMGHASDWYEVNQGGNGQDLENNMHGSILRIDIDNGDPYAIPADNPSLSENYPEIWAFGFRNPYRIAFDPAGNNDLFVGDAGQELWEEVSIVTAGGNYGWNVREGAHCFSTADPGNPNAILDCPTEDPQGNPLVDPIIEFPNTKHPDGGIGTVIIGGVVYRGASLPAWDGRYLFGQWSTRFQSPRGGLFVASRAEDGSWAYEAIQIANREGGDLSEFLLAFGQDQDGEVYILTTLNSGPDGNTGSVYQLSPP